MDGVIKSCSTANCSYKCCDFNQGNYIVLFPNELAYAKKNKFSIAHLRIIEKIDDHSFKVICNAKNRVNCDNGYKPTDCKIYPIFPVVNDKYILKGEKCPLTTSHIEKHIENSKKHIKNLPYIQFKELNKWLQHIKLVGYKLIKLNV
ncbi:hypothetical protein [Tenacibaculum amylolyticum]|uniref:hypothetical protein n=1 Tax=Tenacibaculum amylolyticum TaxID=104269 RepID=UPI003894671C